MIAATNYLLKFGELSPIDTYNKFKEVYESDSQSNRFSLININNVSTTNFHNLRKFKDSEKPGNLKLVGTDEQTINARENIKSKGFNLEEIN